jgi:Lactonase, 7-bladed beta-propeller
LDSNASNNLTFDLFPPPHLGGGPDFITIQIGNRNGPRPDLAGETYFAVLRIETTTGALRAVIAGNRLSGIRTGTASDRGNNSTTLFGINAKDGTLTRFQVTSTRGEIPRHFAIDPILRSLVAKNQNTDTMVSFRIGPKTRQPTPTGDVVKTPSPVCIVFPTR